MIIETIFEFQPFLQVIWEIFISKSLYLFEKDSKISSRFLFKLRVFAIPINILKMKFD